MTRLRSGSFPTSPSVASWDFATGCDCPPSADANEGSKMPRLFSGKAGPFGLENDNLVLTKWPSFCVLRSELPQVFAGEDHGFHVYFAQEESELMEKVPLPLYQVDYLISGLVDSLNVNSL